MGRRRRRLAVLLALATLVAGWASAVAPPVGASTPSVTSGPPPGGAWGEPYSHTFTANPTGASWAVTSGSLPLGLSLDPATGELAGTPTEIGTIGPVTVQAAWDLPYVSVAAGGFHTCALTAGDAVDCWGDDSVGQATDQPGPYTAITAGGTHTCALTTGGAADCWGDNTSGQATDQAGPYTAIRAGSLHTCALTTTGAADCWGNDTSGQATDQAGPFTEIATGGFHTCALTATGAADCWGDDSYGQATDQAGPYTAIAAGEYHTCALTATGAADCWGDDSYGQATDQAGPYTAIAAGGTHTCALTITGAADCWGNSFSGEAADQAGPFTAIAAGDSHSCALTPTGAVDCWGSGSYGQATDQTSSAATASQSVSITIDPPSVTSAPPADGLWGQPYSHTFTASVPGATWSVSAGALPAGLTLDPSTGSLAGTPTGIGTVGPITARAAWPDAFTAISASENHSCALTSVAAHCWGYDYYGQATDQTSAYTAIAAGGLHTCALTRTGAADCWGDDSAGQATDQAGPYTAITAGDGYNCALTPAGAADCWGDNGYGRATDQAGPYTAIAAGRSHTCALTTTGAADCWGDDSAGQATDQAGPYTAITAAYQHSCALTPTGAADCWGSPSGRWPFPDQPGPYTAIDAGTGLTCALTPSGDVDCWDGFAGTITQHSGPYTAVAVGGYHVCALTSGGAADCWGDNSLGRATDQVAEITAEQTVSFDVLSAPSIWPVGAQSMDQDSTLVVPFAVWDSDQLPVDLTVTVGSDDQALLPDAGLVVTGSPTVSSRSLSITPAAGETGTATVTITVADPDGLTSEASFSVTVEAATTSVSGTLTGTGGEAADGVLVTLFDATGFTVAGSTFTAADGTYAFTGLPAGDHRLRFWDPQGRYAVTYWADAPTYRTATIASPTLASPAIADQVLEDRPGGQLGGRITTDATTPIADVVVQVYSITDGYVAAGRTNANGWWTVGSLRPGGYRIRFVDLTGTHEPEWYDDAATGFSATPVTVTDGYVRADAQLAPI